MHKITDTFRVMTALAASAMTVLAAPAIAAQYGDNHRRASAYSYSAEGCLSEQSGLASNAAGQTDYFEISIAQGQQRLQVDATPSSLLFELLDSNGAPVMGNGADFDAGAHAIDQYLPAGQYYFAVSEAAAEYDLCWRTLPAASAREDGYEPNNDSAQATDMQAHEERWLSAALGEYGRQLDADWYRMDIDSVANNEQLVVLVQTSSYEGVVQLALYDNSGNRVASDVSSEGSRDAMILRADVVAGRYSVAVTSDNNGDVYDLCWGLSAQRAPVLGLQCSHDPAAGNASRTAQAASTGDSQGGAGAGGLEIALLILLLMLFARWRRNKARKGLAGE